MGEIDAHVDPSVLEGDVEPPGGPWWVGRVRDLLRQRYAGRRGGSAARWATSSLRAGMNSVTAAHVYKTIHPRDPSGCPWPSWSGVTFLVLRCSSAGGWPTTHVHRPATSTWLASAARSLPSRWLRWGVHCVLVRRRCEHNRPAAAAYTKKALLERFFVTLPITSHEPFS